MKNSTIISNLATLSLGAFLTACGGAEMSASSEQPGLDSSEPKVAAEQSLGDTAQALTACDDPQYDHWRYISALAVAAGNELGRWNIADFTSGSSGVALSAAGLARCTNGCANIQAILALQTVAAGSVPRLDPNLLKQYLTGFYTDQVGWQNTNGYNEHKLVPSGVSPASCGYRYAYRDTLVKNTGTTTLKPAVSGKCMDVASTADQANVIQKTCASTTSQNFVLEPIMNGGYRLKNGLSGKCVTVPNVLSGTPLNQQNCGGVGQPNTFDMIDLGGGRFQLRSYVAANLCVEVASSSQNDGAQLRVVACNAASTAQQFAATVTKQSFDNPSQANMVNYLRFVGGGTQNQFIQFQWDAQNVSLDPMGTMVDGGASGQSGSCIDAASAFDSTRAIAGKCCTYSGKFGTFQASAWNTSFFICK